MLHEWRAAARSLRHRKGLAVTVILTLMLGIGANSAIFSVVDAVLLKPLPYPDADRLVSLYELNTAQAGATQLVAPPRLEEWNRLNRSFDGIAGRYFENMTDTTGPLPERVETMRTSPRFFSVLGVAPALGRAPTGREEAFGGPRIAVVSDGFWRHRMDADPSAVGRALVLGGASYTVIGIMPPSFRYPTATTEIWIPAQSTPGMLQQRRARFYTAVGRLKPGVTLEQAKQDLDAIQARLGEQFPDTDKGWAASLVLLKEEEVGGLRRSLWFLLAAVALVLLAACGNVACLLLADGTRREHEVAVRFALGADRRRVIAQLLREGFLLACGGTALGLLVANWGVAALRTAATQLPPATDFHVDTRLVAFTLVVGVATTLLFALAPAAQATRRDPADALARGGRGHAGGRHRLQLLLVGAQVALAIVLLVGAGLLTRSFMRMQDVSVGLDASQVLTFRMSAQWTEQLASVVQRQKRTIDRLQAIPGVEAAAFSQTRPAAADFPPAEFQVVGRDSAEHTFANNRAVSAGYFRTLHIPILKGETCSAEPSKELIATKVLVTRAFSDRFFPGEDPIGHAIRSAGLPPGTSADIIGIVGDVRERGPLKAAEPLIYWCGFSPYWPDPVFMVRTDPARAVSIGVIRAALREIEPNRAVYAISPLSELIAASFSQQRLNAVLIVLFAAMALFLAAMGLYGVLSQLVSSRRREIGVRMALGARPTQIVTSVVAHAVTIAGFGIIAGIAGALVLARFMTMLVFGIPAHDPLTFALVPIVLAAVAILTALVPARRAARIDPMTSLRDT
jgi:putative ABC transport system permease protein